MDTLNLHGGRCGAILLAAELRETVARLTDLAARCGEQGTAQRLRDAQVALWAAAQLIMPLPENHARVRQARVILGMED